MLIIYTLYFQNSKTKYNNINISTVSLSLLYHKSIRLCRHFSGMISVIQKNQNNDNDDVLDSMDAKVKTMENIG